MASVLTTSFANEVLDTRLAKRARWLALFAADPGPAGSLADEFAGGGYERVRLKFTSPGSRQLANSENIVFDDLLAGTLRYFGVTDAASAGRVLLLTELSQTGLAIPAGSRLVIPAGDLVWAL